MTGSSAHAAKTGWCTSWTPATCRCELLLLVPMQTQALRSSLPCFQNARPVLSFDTSPLGYPASSVHFASRQNKRFIICGSKGNRFVSLWDWGLGNVTCVQVLDLFPYIAGKCELLVDQESSRLFILDGVRPAVLEAVLGEEACFETVRHLHLPSPVSSAAIFKDGDLQSIFASLPSGVASISLPKAKHRPNFPRQHGSELDVQSLARKLSELLAQQVCFWCSVQCAYSGTHSPSRGAAIDIAG